MSNSMFDRLGSLLRDYIDNDNIDQDIFSKESIKHEDIKHEDIKHEDKNNFNTTKKTETKRPEKDNTQKFFTGNSKKKENTFTFGKIYPKEIIESFTTLCISPSSSYEECKEAYKKMLIKYHPDKHSNNLRDQKDATEITAQLNLAFSRLKTWFSTH